MLEFDILDFNGRMTKYQEHNRKVHKKEFVVLFLDSIICFMIDDCQLI